MTATDAPTPEPSISTAQSPDVPYLRYSHLQRCVLEILAEQDAPMPQREVLAAVPRRLVLNPAELQLTADNSPRYRDAIIWGTVDMVAAGWIKKLGKPGWTITAEGLKLLSTTTSDDDIAKISSLAYRKQQKAKRQAAGRFKTATYPLIDAAVKLVSEGHWTSYSDVARATGTSPSTVGDYVHTVELDGHHRVAPVDQPPYKPEFIKLLEDEGILFSEDGLPNPQSRVRAEDLRELMDEAGLLPKVARRAWLVRSTQDGHDFMASWRQFDNVTLPASRLRALKSGASRDEVKAAVDEDYAHASYADRAEMVDEFHAFLTRMQQNDVIVSVDQGALVIGIITGDAQHQNTFSAESFLVRDVEWQPGSGTSLGVLPTPLATRLKVQREVVDLTEQLGVIEGIMEGDPSITGAKKVILRAATSALATELHVPQPWLQECIDLLNDRPQLIFHGPPGTGKTYLAQAIAKHVAGDNVRLVQFHPAYSYEDFFEGFRPTDQGTFALKPGPLRKIVDQAKREPHEAHVLVIDEINRGNLAKIFGELYFLLEYRTENVELLYADEEFNLPENVFIIGTMNTADRSIALVDAAMRRRFAFLPLHPSEEPTDQVLRSWLASEGLPTRAADLLDELNGRIADSDFKIGPSYFMRPAVHQDGGLERTWRTSILPLLEEHHYGELDARQVRRQYGLETIAAAVEGTISAAKDLNAVPGSH